MRNINNGIMNIIEKNEEGAFEEEKDILNEIDSIKKLDYFEKPEKPDTAEFDNLEIMT